MSDILRTDALCTGSDVTSLLRSYKDAFTDADGGFTELYAAINDSDDEIDEDFGNPVENTEFFMYDKSNFIFEYWPDRKKTYRIDRVVMRGSDNSRNLLTNGGSADVETATMVGGVLSFNGVAVADDSDTYYYDYNANVLMFPYATLLKYQSFYCEVDFVRRIFHVLSKNKAALVIAEDNPEITGDDVEHTRVARFRKRITRIENLLYSVQAVDGENALLNKENDVRTRMTIIQKRFNNLS